MLFVCNQNRVRSLTAEQLYRPRPDLEVKSAGVAENAGVPLTQELFEWADQVFVFSKTQKIVIQQRYPEVFGTKPVVCLRLRDRFQYKSPKLITALTEKLGPYLGPPANTDPAPAPRRRWRPQPRRSQSGIRHTTVWSALCSLGMTILGAEPEIARSQERLTPEPGV